MSYNQPPPQQPGPYGGQPQQPGPYGQQPGYGYPQQGQPQPGPYGGQPGQPPYGQPPFPPPGPSGGSGKKTVAVVVASVVAVCAVIGSIVVMSGGDEESGSAKNSGSSAQDSSDSSSDGSSDGSSEDGSSDGSAGDPADADRDMKLVTPKTLDGGTYVLDKDTAGLKEEGTSVQDGMPPGATSVLARYKRAGDSTGTAGLAFSGAYGAIGEPDTVEDDMYKGFEQSSAATVEKERKEYQPEGADGPEIDCEVVKMQGAVYVPVCTWAEKSDAAMVMDINARNTSAEAVDVEAFAKVTAGIYKDTRKPA